MSKKDKATAVADQPEAIVPVTPGAIEVTSPSTPEWWTPQNLSEAKMIANEIAKSGLVPDGYTNKPEKVLTAWLFGSPLGLGVLSCLQFTSVVKGKPSLYGDAIPAVVKRARGKIEETFEGEFPSDDFKAVCKVTRPGHKDVVRDFSIQDAKTAGLWGMKSSKGEPMPWSMYPKRMLQMRARAFACRDQFPDALAGILIAEEVEDFRDITDDVVIRDVDETKGSAGLAGKLNARRDAMEAHMPDPTDSAPTEPEDSASNGDADQCETGEAFVDSRPDHDDITFVYGGRERYEINPESAKLSPEPWAVWVDPGQPIEIVDGSPALVLQRVEPKDGAPIIDGRIAHPEDWAWHRFEPKTKEAIAIVRKHLTKDVREAAKEARVPNSKLLAWCNAESKAEPKATSSAEVPIVVLARAYWAIVDGELHGVEEKAKDTDADRLGKGRKR